MDCLHDDPRFLDIQKEKELLKDQLQLRGNEFKKATMNYITSLNTELEIFNQNNEKFDKRNDGFKRDVENVMTRYRIGVGNISKAQDRLNYEKEKINAYIIKNFSSIAGKVKTTLNDEKQKIEQIIDDELDFRNRPHEEAAVQVHRDRVVYKDRNFVTNYHDLYQNVNQIMKETEGERKRDFVYREKEPMSRAKVVAENRGNRDNYGVGGFREEMPKTTSYDYSFKKQNQEPPRKSLGDQIDMNYERFGHDPIDTNAENIRNENWTEHHKTQGFNILTQFMSSNDAQFLPKPPMQDFHGYENKIRASDRNINHGPSKAQFVDHGYDSGAGAHNFMHSDIDEGHHNFRVSDRPSGGDFGMKEDHGFVNRNRGHKEEFNYNTGWNEGDFSRIESKVFSEGKSGLDWK